MNTYIQNLNRIEFLVTLACTGRCKHCSEGDHATNGECIDSHVAVQVIYKLCNEYNIESTMTFGGEPLLHPDEVCKIHTAAREMNIPERSLITNGFFSQDEGISIRTNPAWLVNKEAENPEDVHSICIYPNGNVLGDNIYRSDIADIIKNYVTED